MDQTPPLLRVTDCESDGVNRARETEEMPLSVTLSVGDLSLTRVFLEELQKFELCTDLSEKRNTLKGSKRTIS